MSSVVQIKRQLFESVLAVGTVATENGLSYDSPSYIYNWLFIAALYTESGQATQIHY